MSEQKLPLPLEEDICVHIFTVMVVICGFITYAIAL